MDTIRNYLDIMFKDFPKSTEVERLKNNMLENMEEKYLELKKLGNSENESVGKVISEFGNIDELKEEFHINCDPESNSLFLSTKQIVEYLKGQKRYVLCITFSIALMLVVTGSYPLIEVTMANEAIASSIFSVSIALAVTIIVISMMNDKKVNKFMENRELFYDNQGKQIVDEMKDRYESKGKYYVSIGIFIIISSPAVYVLLENSGRFIEEKIIFVFMILMAIGISLLVYAGLKDSYLEKLTNELEENKSGSVYALLFTCGAVLYVGLGLIFPSTWQFGWIIFPICWAVGYAYNFYMKKKNI